MCLLYQSNFNNESDLNALKNMVAEWDLDDNDILYIKDIISDIIET